MHTDRESLEAFCLRLTGQAALCGWTIDQEKEVMRDIFIAIMRYKDVQRELCIRPGATPEETLKSALLQENGAQTATDLQNQFGSSSTMGSFSHSIQFGSEYTYQTGTEIFRSREEIVG